MGMESRKIREQRPRKQLILEAAKKVAAANGFHKTTMSQVAREAAISPGTIYLYFKNKEELFGSLVLNPLQFIELSIGDIWRTHKKANVGSKIAALQRVLIEAYKFDPVIFANLFHLLSVERLDCLTPHVLSRVKQIFRKIHRHLVNLFNDGKVKTEAVNPLKAMDNLFFVLLSGVTIWSSIRNHLFEDDVVSSYEESCNEALDLFLLAAKTALNCSSTH